MRFAITLISTMAFLSPAWGQVCSTQTTRGTYSATCSGFLSPAAGAPQAPASLIGVCKSDPQGVFNCTSKVSLGGAIVDQTVIGTAVVNSDCTGTISYDQKINGQPVPKLNIVFHVLDDGKELRGMAVDAGTTLSCNLRLMSR